jgi:6-phosphogluconolactonase
MIREFATRDALMHAAASRIADALRSGIGVRGEAWAALSGGSTPAPAYRALAALPVDWGKVAFGLVDERFVPNTDAASNEAMIRQALGPALDAGAKLLSMFSSGATLEQAAQKADAAYADVGFDIAVLGMGEDGHTASWFADADRLEEALDVSTSRSVIALRAPSAAHTPDRLTLTRRAISRARVVMLLLTGAEKRARLEAALKARDAPVAALFEQPESEPEVWWAP